MVARRTALVLGSMLVVCAGLVSWLVSRDGAASSPIAVPTSSAALFSAHCASCHTVEGLRQRIVSADATRRAEMEGFLRRHASATDDEDRLILRYLTGARDSSADRAR